MTIPVLPLLPPDMAPRHPRPSPRPRATASGLAALLAAAAACVAVGGCANSQPAPVGMRELAEAQAFPFYRVYWAGPRFGANPLAAADGLRNYDTTTGDSVYYGSCVSGKSSALGSSGCVLPLQIATLVYVRHANASLGAQRNTILRGVPAVIYEGGRSIELYSGRLAIDVFSESPAAGLRAVRALRPLNAPGSAREPLPPPVYCPGLSGPRPAALKALLRDLPGHPCQRAAQALTVDRALFGKG